MGHLRVPDKIRHWPEIRTPEFDRMADERDESRANFTYFSNEYAQALQAIAAIEKQAATIVAFGAPDELRTFIEQFVMMAEDTRRSALEKGEANFAEWFGELIEKAEAIRDALGVRP